MNNCKAILSFVAARGLMDADRMTQDEYRQLCQNISQDANSAPDARKRASDELADLQAQ